MARTVSSARARSVITVLSEAVIGAAPLPTRLNPIGTLAMGSTPSRSRSPIAPASACALAEPTPGIPGVHRARHGLGGRRRLHGCRDGNWCAPQVVARKPAFETLTRHAHAVASAVELAGPPSKDLDFGAVGDVGPCIGAGIVRQRHMRQ